MQERFEKLSKEEQYKIVMTDIKELDISNTETNFSDKAKLVIYKINISKFSYNLRKLLLEEVKLKINMLKSANLKTK